eukprot:CAMPEP_0117675060 /NCGR_PEP_ID=MMETSP0804-20121206/15394_1 /TAXON_ID=1074897 /ORGANISM="Tetraselmis astigmatica, Strain CCMP880" /LENGTH=152 /DNA_ID=CAMNT_0005484019 /DNA_START=115 /DNA_END=574 /DNA_ORIENTATION=+
MGSEDSIVVVWLLLQDGGHPCSLRERNAAGHHLRVAVELAGSRPGQTVPQEEGVKQLSGGGGRSGPAEPLSCACHEVCDDVLVEAQRVVVLEHNEAVEWAQYLKRLLAVTHVAVSTLPNESAAVRFLQSQKSQRFPPSVGSSSLSPGAEVND